MWQSGITNNLKPLICAVLVVIATNGIALLLVETPLIAVIDEFIPIGERGFVPGGRRPAAISRFMSPIMRLTRLVLLPYYYFDNFLSSVLVLLFEVGFIALVFWLCVHLRYHFQEDIGYGAEIHQSEESPYEPPPT